MKLNLRSVGCFGVYISPHQTHAPSGHRNFCMKFHFAFRQDQAGVLPRRGFPGQNSASRILSGILNSKHKAECHNGGKRMSPLPKNHHTHRKMGARFLCEQ